METPLEHTLTHAHKEGMLSFVAENPEAIDELIQLALIDKQPYSWRSAWLLTSVMENNDPRVKAFIPQIIEKIPKAIDGQKRDLMRILTKMQIDEEHEGPLFDICADIWCKVDKIPSVRFNAFRLMLQVTEKYPELVNEVAYLTQDHYMETLSDGVKRSLRKRLKKAMGTHP